MDLLVRPPLLTHVRAAWWRAADLAAATVYGLAAAMLLAKHAAGVVTVAGALVGAVAVAWPIAERRRRPRGAFLLSLTAFGALAAWQPRDAVAALVPLGLALYAVARSARPRTAVLALLVALAAAGATALPDFRHVGAAALFGAAYTTAWTIGYAVGMHRRYTDDLLQGQARLARAELDQARGEVNAHRMRIARELHDIVAHHMSVITVQAGYGGLLLDEAGTPAEADARAALSVIEDTGRQALEEIRRLVGVLRADDTEAFDDDGTGQDYPASDLAPAPGLRDLPRLIEHAARAGVDAHVVVSGHPQALPPGEDLAAYRIVQEAMTNVIKHSGGAATIRLDYAEEQLTIDVVDDGPAAGQKARQQRQGSHSRRGLAGMRERAALYGGTLHAGPTVGGGFQVTALLPLASNPDSLAYPHATETRAER